MIRHPDENHEAVHRWLLERNLKLYGVAYAVDPRTGMVLAMGAIDNLARGASAQAVQALNVASGWPDELGLPEVALFP